MATAYNGWPASTDPAAIGVDPDFTVDGMRFPGGVKAGDVAVVFTDLIRHLAELDPPTSTDYAVEGFWGYSAKMSANSPDLVSCHAAGCAIDWRAVAHPNGSAPWYGYTPAAAAAIRDLLAGRYRGLVANLSDQPTPDPMHYEISGTPDEIARLAHDLAADQPEDDTVTDDDIDKIADAVLDKLRTANVVRMVTVDPDTGDEDAADVDIVRALSSAQTQSARTLYTVRYGD